MNCTSSMQYTTVCNSVFCHSTPYSKQNTYALCLNETCIRGCVNVGQAYLWPFFRHKQKFLTKLSGLSNNSSAEVRPQLSLLTTVEESAETATAFSLFSAVTLSIFNTVVKADLLTTVIVYTCSVDGWINSRVLNCSSVTLYMRLLHLLFSRCST